MNHLSKEKSPYLLQHADNPVHWFPWSKEAFDKAQAENKPIFLSIGYSTCHWCHVMAHESFEDEGIAAVLNEHFISIKVDREERPDIDGIYMAAVQAISGQGGWPLSVFLTPDKKPFFGGTYFPPHARYGTPGFPDVLLSVQNAWVNNRSKIDSSSQQLSDLLKQRNQGGGSGEVLGIDILNQAFHEFLSHYDVRYGGFGQYPKFPTGHNISFLLRYWQRNDSQQAIDMVLHTLMKMAQGGLYDQIGGGFHRYSTDAKWQIPHFEKMLYDQAMLVKAYTESYQATHRESFAVVVHETLEYVLRDMTSPLGGFYSAEDADSYDYQEYLNNPLSAVKKEGAFYVWSFDEIKRLLSPIDTDIFNYYFGIEIDGNAEMDPHGEFVGKNIVAVVHSLDETAAHFKLSVDSIVQSLQSSKKILFEARLNRPRPHLDDKILTDWNGLMISAFAVASQALGENRYLTAAKKSAEFILQAMRGPSGKLLHRYRDSDAAILGNVEDYAFFIQGLLDIYEASFDVYYLEEAVFLAKQMLDLFWDKELGGFYFASEEAKDLIYRQKEIYDGASPSGNSVAALVLLRLSRMTFDDAWGKKAEELFKAFAKTIEERPSAYAQMLMAIDFMFGPTREIVIALGHGQSSSDFMAVINDSFIPNKIIVCRPNEGPDLKRIVKISPFVENQPPIDGQGTVYVCQNFVCSKPVQTVGLLKSVLNINP